MHRPTNTVVFELLDHLAHIPSPGKPCFCVCVSQDRSSFGLPEVVSRSSAQELGQKRILTIPVYSHPSLLFPTAHWRPPRIKRPCIVGIRGLLCCISSIKSSIASRRKISPRSNGAKRGSSSGMWRQAWAKMTFSKNREKQGPPRAISR